MRNSIFWKFVTAYFLFAVLGFLTINFATTNQTYNHLIETYHETMQKEADTIAANLSAGVNPDSADYYATALFHFNEISNSSIWITDAAGSILYSTQELETKNIPGFNLNYFEGSTYHIGNFFKCFSNNVLTAYAPVTPEQDTVGYVFIHLPASMILSESAQIVDIFYISYFVILFISLILIFSFIVYLYLPLMEMRRATLEFANGNFAYDKLKVHTNDEIGDLASSLVYMAHELNEAEEYQKKFVSNISHDFRSPLTSIKGYVEAVMDGTIPPEMQNKYLGIVLSETERLERLTNGLLDLNTWGNKAPGLIYEDFNIDDVIVSIIQTFGGTCEKKHISIKFASDAPHMVYADKGKIEQVLYNLIDNAIKFSFSDSDITIRVYNKGDRLFCSVKDSGTGISNKDIKKIWDRFYKTDSSRGKDRTGSGIGLAIVREIINAHDQTIDVISTEGVGTEFIFSLLKSNSRSAKKHKKMASS